MDALEAEQRLRHGPALVQFAHEVGGRRAHVVEKHFAEFLVPGDVADSAHAHTGRLQSEQQEADARLFLRRLVGAREHEYVRRIVRQRGPGLLPVDDEFVAIEPRLGVQVGEVGAGIGFGIALAPDFLAGEYRRQITAALRFGAEAHQYRPDHEYAVVLKARDAPALHLLEEDQQFRRGEAHAAVLARPAGRDPALGRHAQVPGLVLGPAQAPRRVAQFGRVVRLDFGAHDCAKRLVRERVPVLLLFHAVTHASSAILA